MAVEPLALTDCGILTAIGSGKTATAQALARAERALTPSLDYFHTHPVMLGQVTTPLPEIPAPFARWNARNNQMLLAALQQIASTIAALRAQYGPARIAVVMGTSTSGTENGERAYATYAAQQHWPDGYNYHQQETSSPSDFAAAWCGITGPAFTIATACSSSAKVFASARRLIDAGVVDAAIVGGVDTLCRMTVRGFHALEILSPTVARPFSPTRDGISIGEGAAVFVLQRGDAPVHLLGVGETADAHHLTAPDPEGSGAAAAMQHALAEAGLAPSAIRYINLHGTGTPLNDAAEAHALARVFGAGAVPCSSTKGMTGHLLGASGACEAAFLWLTLHPDHSSGALPAQVSDGEPCDPRIPPLALVAPHTPAPREGACAMLSNAFGFGGSNVSLILGRR